MPLYSFRCQQGCDEERYLPLAEYDSAQVCATHREMMWRTISAPLMLKVQPDVRYNSPVDGRHITSMNAHREDLKRNNCVAYDPEVKTDSKRRQRESEESLAREVSDTVESFVEKLPTKRRGQLMSEMTERGQDIAFARQ